MTAAHVSDVGLTGVIGDSVAADLIWGWMSEEVAWWYSVSG